MKTISGKPMGEALATPENAQPAEVPRMRRSGKDRRVRDRRAEDVEHKARRARNARITVLLLSGATLILLTHFGFSTFIASLQRQIPPRAAVVVEIDEVGTWRCAPKDLANSLATEDVLRQSRSIAPEVRLDMIALKAENLLNRREALIRKIQDMPWREFERHATFRRASAVARQPTQAELENALRIAVIREEKP